WVVVGRLVAGVVAAGVLLWFQPQKLLIDKQVDETAPAAGASRAAGGVALSAAGVRSPGPGTSGRAGGGVGVGGACNERPSGGAGCGRREAVPALGGPAHQQRAGPVLVPVGDTGGRPA